MTVKVLPPFLLHRRIRAAAAATFGFRMDGKRGPKWVFENFNLTDNVQKDVLLIGDFVPLDLRFEFPFFARQLFQEEKQLPEERMKLIRIRKII